MEVKLNLAENGIDSLRKGFEAFNEYERWRYVSASSAHVQAVALKDSIIFVHHGIEILLKAVLLASNELLVIDEVDNTAKQALAEKRTRNRGSIFDTSVSGSLRTVSVMEAVDRVEKVCGIPVGSELKLKLKDIVRLRNNVAHATLSVEESEIAAIFDRFIDLIDRFFLGAFGSSYKTVSGYDKLMEAATDATESIADRHAETKRETLGAFRDAFDASGISMGPRETRHIIDINVATKFLNRLFTSDLKFGADIFDGANSGDVSGIDRIDQYRFDVVARDISCRWRFDFNSMIIWMTGPKDAGSPILVFVSNTVENEIRDNVDFKENERRGRYADGLKFRKENDVCWDRNRIQEYYMRIDCEGNIDSQLDYSIRYYLDGGLFCFVNVQGLLYPRQLGSQMERTRQKDPKELELEIRQTLMQRT